MYQGEKGEREAIEAQKPNWRPWEPKFPCWKIPWWPFPPRTCGGSSPSAAPGEFLDEAVADFIREHGLYGANANWKNLPMPELEKVVVPLMKEKRVAHIFGCRQTAVELARLYGADETDAARAGLLHDITRPWTDPCS